jgi:hypothetical protein
MPSAAATAAIRTRGSATIVRVEARDAAVILFGLAMRYLTHTPARPLGDFVEYMWLLSDAPPHAWELIVPSGTIELVINLRADEFRIYDAAQPQRYRQFSGAMVSGAYSAPFVTDTLAHASIIGVHFRPGGAFPFFREPINELADLHIDLHDLWRGSGPSSSSSVSVSVAELRERLCVTRTPAERCWRWRWRRSWFAR